MSVNKYLDHILILPEDDANKDIINGFQNRINVNTRKLQILPPAGGWKKVIENFSNNNWLDMETFKNRRIILLIDLDQEMDRIESIKKRIPKSIQDRVFIFGVLSEPEDLKSQTKKSLETIGGDLAKDCPNEISDLWNHELLKHNKDEVDPFRKSVKFLFNNDGFIPTD
jgi:hypothetical protein